MDAWRSPLLSFDDIRVAWWWGWIMVNEPYLEVQFILGKKNVTADLLSRSGTRLCVVAMKLSGQGEENDIVKDRNDVW